LRGEAGNAALLGLGARLAGARERRGYSAGAQWRRERGRVGDDAFRRLESQAASRFAIDERHELRLSARFTTGEGDDYPDGSGGPLRGSGRLRHSEHDALSFGAELELGAAPERRQRIALSFSGRRLFRQSPAIPPLVPDAEERTRFARLRLAWQAPLLRGARTALDLGLSGEGEWADNVSLLHLPPDFGGDTPGSYRKTRASGGPYVEVRHERAPWLFESALRADAVSTGRWQLNPRAGVVWRPRAGTSVRISGGRAAKLPSFFALASPEVLGGNPALRPERTTGGEAGASQSWPAARLELAGTLFLHDYTDLVDFDFELFRNLNRAHVRAKGAELSLAWRPRESFSALGAATWLLAHDRADLPLRQRPRWQGSASLTWQARPRLGLRVQAQGVSRYLDQQLPVPERDSVAGHLLLAASLWCRVAPGVELRVGAGNLANRFYETYIGFPGPRRSFSAALTWPAP
jgi:hypothetical protein